MLTASIPAPRSPVADDRLAVSVAFAQGRAGVLLDHGGALLAFPAATATMAQLHFAIRYSSGLVHAAMPSARLAHLRIPDQWRMPSEDSGTGFTVAVDAAEGITTGISAGDRAHTLRVLADPQTVPDDLIRPGHVMPIRCADGGFGEAPRPWELAVDLTVAAGHAPVAVACRLIGEDGDTMNGDAAQLFAEYHGLPLCVPLHPQASVRRHLHIAGADRA
jgi:3,4-dihydroxy 2-butanone 4-phosphate synthase